MIKPKSFRSLVPEQTLLSSPLLIDWLPKGLLVFFQLELPTGLDFEVFLAPSSHKDRRGEKGLGPGMMALLLLAACCIGIPPPAGSSLPAARTLSFGCSPATNSWITAGISDFRRRHLRAREALAVQVLRLCRKAGMVSQGH